MNQTLKLEHPVTTRWLLRFALPTIISNIVMNIYSTVDGIFVARWVNTDGLSAINITMPMIFLISALGMMFGSGGNALVAKKIGEGKHREAKEDFSLLVVVAFVFSVVLAVLCFLFLDPLCRFLGSDDALLPLCRAYMIPVLVTIPFAIFGIVFQMSYITVGKANLGLIFSLLGGVLNVVLDWLFIAIFHWGIAGAAIATGIGYAVPSLIGVVWFCVKREQALCIVRPKWRLHTLLQSCANGASEMVSVLAFSVVTILFNNILMNLAGSDGVASLTIIWYAQELFSGMFRGYITGVSSVVSYNLGKGDKERLARAFRISIRTIAVAGVAVVAVSCLAGGAVIGFFAKGNQNVYDVALRGFRIVAVSFILMAYNVFSSGWFTALNDGKTSAILSFCRTILFMVVPVLVLPRLFGVDGVWLSLSVGEGLSLLMTIYYFVKYRKVWTPERGTVGQTELQ